MRFTVKFCGFSHKFQIWIYIAFNEIVCLWLYFFHLQVLFVFKFHRCFHQEASTFHAFYFMHSETVAVVQVYLPLICIISYSRQHLSNHFLYNWLYSSAQPIQLLFLLLLAVPSPCFCQRIPGIFSILVHSAAPELKLRFIMLVRVLPDKSAAFASSPSLPHPHPRPLSLLAA